MVCFMDGRTTFRAFALPQIVVPCYCFSYGDRLVVRVNALLTFVVEYSRL